MGSPVSTCPGGEEDSNNNQQKRMVIVGPEEINYIGPNIDKKIRMSNEGGYFGNSNDDAAVSNVSPNNILDETREHDDDDRRDDNYYEFDDDDQDLNNGDCTIISNNNKKKKMNTTFRGYDELQVVNEFPFIVPSFSSSSSLLRITKSSSSTKESNSNVDNALPIAGFHTTPTSTANNTNNETNNEITFLIEVAKATIPKTKRKGWVNNLPRNTNKKDFGIHCTATWVGPVNPSGRRRREWPLHRTMTLGVSCKNFFL
jgi:hypothetical protein